MTPYSGGCEWLSLAGVVRIGELGALCGSALDVSSRVAASAAAGRQKVWRHLARHSFSAPVLNLDPPVKEDRRLEDGWTLVWISRMPFGHISACSF